MPHANRSLARKLRLPGIATLSALSLLACGGGGGGGGSVPTLQALTLGAEQTYAIVGTPLKLTLTGTYSDGKSAPVTSGATFASSDPSVASVDDLGTVAPWKAGLVHITAKDVATGLTATTDVTTRVVVSLTAGKALPASGQVDVTEAFFRVSGLTPGGMYAPAVFDLSDDVDLTVYSDISMLPETKLCASGRVGKVAENCTAPANASGELWLAIDGQWTQSGATFDLDVPAAAPVTLAGTLAYPAGLPHNGAEGATKQFLKVTGLTPGAAYEARISNLIADLDLEVYTDAYEYASVCESISSGTVDDYCTATAGSAGEFIIEVDGETSPAGGSYTLSLTAK